MPVQAPRAIPVFAEPLAAVEPNAGVRALAQRYPAAPTRPTIAKPWLLVNWSDPYRKDYDPWPLQSASSVAGAAWVSMADTSRIAVAFGQLLLRDTSRDHSLHAALAFRGALHIEVRLALHRAGIPLEELKGSLERLLQQAVGQVALAELVVRAEELQFDRPRDAAFVHHPELFTSRHLADVKSAIFARDEPRGGLLSLAVAACRGEDRQ